MSTGYHLYCVDCASSHDLTFINRPERCAQVWEARSQLIFTFAQLRKATDMLDFVEFDQSFLTAYAADNGGHITQSHIEWLHNHSCHRVHIKDEYGRFVDQCWKNYLCDHCGSWLYCKRPKDHEGPCGPNEGEER